MGLFSIFKKSKVDVSTAAYQSFSTPFTKVGGGNLSLPYINPLMSGGMKGLVYFGQDNLYPQLLVQMYYQSPLHGAIVDFKTNAVAGGGLDFNIRGDSAKDIVAAKSVARRMGLEKLAPTITRELIVHGRVYFLLNFKDGKIIKSKFISSDKVRTNREKSLYFISPDWSQRLASKTVEPYVQGKKCEEAIYCYEVDSLGQDVYPLPQYSSALNWAFLDGELSYLHKSNIQNSIFPSFAFMFPKKPASQEERDEIADTIAKAKGAANGGKVLAFFANGEEYLPKIEAVPTNNNDQLFLQTDERTDAKICQAHQVDPLIFGIRVSGKLGGGTEIKQAYTIFEKNFVMPTRAVVEEIINDLLNIHGVGDDIIKLRDFQIINEAIVEDSVDGNKVSEAISSLSPLVANKVLESLTTNEIRGLGGLGKIKGGDTVNIPQPDNNFKDGNL